MVCESTAEVKIAILDSGCNIECEESTSFVDDSPDDLNGHGTAIAEIIREINPSAKLYIAKVFTQNGQSIDTTLFVESIDWAISHKVDLMNLSWQTHMDHKPIHDAIQKAHREGITIVAAAGNRDGVVVALIEELSKYSQGKNVNTGVEYPARYEEVIAVGAIRSFWGFSRHEKYSPVGPEIEFVCNGSYGSQKGTSFAAARATAVISRIKADHPSINGPQLRETLRTHACDIGAKGRDTKFGYGRLDSPRELPGFE
jgi:subtilisin family serine protease